MTFIKQFSILPLSLMFLFSAHDVSASVIGEPSCFVVGTVTEVISEERSFSIQINRTEVGDEFGSFCPVEIDEVHTLKEWQFQVGPSGFSFDAIQVGDRIHAGVVSGGSLGEDGTVVSWLHWSDVVMAPDAPDAEEPIAPPEEDATVVEEPILPPARETINERIPDESTVTNDPARERLVDNNAVVEETGERIVDEDGAAVVSGDAGDVVPVGPVTDTQGNRYLILILIVIVLCIAGYAVYRARRRE